MKKLMPLSDIQVPEPKEDQWYSLNFNDRAYRFHGLKKLLGGADISKSGDRNSGLAVTSEVEREAARAILSSLTMQHLYDRPLTDDFGSVDSVMRANYGIDLEVFRDMASLTIGEVKNLLLRADGAEVKRFGQGLTGVMAAALAKIMDVHELIFVARKIEHITKARTRLGLRKTLASRLQPNHPTDDLRGITCLTYLGLCIGSGDALIGVNPSVDTVENISAILIHLDKIRRQTMVPTQICVLGHIKTQMACLERGAPVEIMFQSLAGTERANLTEFDISIDLLDQAYQAMQSKGALAAEAKQFMYFETGQGSEFSYGKHNGIDMATTEALCYGLARRYDPFMVNNVTGFIGPETHLDNFEMIAANLQDHFMGKLLGLPMGMAPCYTLHSKIGLEGQQMATEMLTAAGANFYMDVCLNTDRMLAYFDTSAHDNQTLREIHDKEPSPDYLVWALERGIFRRGAEGQLLRGDNWGNPRIFCQTSGELEELLRVTPSVPGFLPKDHAGPRPANDGAREIRLHQAVGREAIQSELNLSLLKKVADFRLVKTRAADKASHLSHPELGAQLEEPSTDATTALLHPENTDIQIIVSDGLSAEAVHHNIDDLFPVLLDGLIAKGFKLGRHILVPYGRVKLAEPIAKALHTRCVILLIGERPGGSALASRSLSAYLLYHLLDDDAQRKAANFSGNDHIQFEYSVLANIYEAGIPAVEAGSVIVEKVEQMMRLRAAGNRLEALIDEGL